MVIAHKHTFAVPFTGHWGWPPLVITASLPPDSFKAVTTNCQLWALVQIGEIVADPHHGVHTNCLRTLQ